LLKKKDQHYKRAFFFCIFILAEKCVIIKSLGNSLLEMVREQVMAGTAKLTASR
jgi:hypothetical protein